MNLAVLERMVGEGDLSRDAFAYLLNCRGECEWLDYKESLAVEQDYELCAFAKDALAMKNIGGGYLLVGVKDKTWDQIGLRVPFPYGTKLLRDKLVRATGVSLKIDVVQHRLDSSEGQKFFALIP